MHKEAAEHRRKTVNRQEAVTHEHAARHNFAGRLATFLAVSALAGLGGIAGLAAPARQPTRPQPALQLAKQSFTFPGDGKRNQNASIGDFCCTGETATVETEAGEPIGYIYFYDFPGGGIILRDRAHSATKRFSVLVSGLSEASQPESPRVKSSIAFEVDEMKVGSQKQTTAGKLQFTATIEAVEFDNSAGTRYRMDSVRCKVEVRVIR